MGGWLFLTGTILLEITARLRGLSAPHAAGSGAAAGRRPRPGRSRRPALRRRTHHHRRTHRGRRHRTRVGHRDARPQRHCRNVPARRSPTAATRADPATREHTVTRGESLWSIARDHLGDGARYPEIADLNTDALAGRPAFLLPGTVLTLPTPDPPDAPAGEEGTYTVRKGDTLSGIAHEQLGDAGRYPEIFDASRHITQPGGEHLSDPDVIDIGWTLAIPEQPSGRGDRADRPTPPSRPGRGRTPPVPVPGPRHRPHGTARPWRRPRRRTPGSIRATVVGRTRGHAEVGPAERPCGGDE